MPVVLSLPSNVQFFHRGDKVVAINPDIPSWIVTNANGETALKLCTGSFSLDEIVSVITDEYGQDFAEQTEAFLLRAAASRLFDTPRGGEVPLAEAGGRLDIVQLSISEDCNLHCKYCYASDRKESQWPSMTLDDYCRVIDEITALSPDAKFTLTGGEPLLNRNCFAIAKYIKGKGNYVDILTNGTLINDSNIQLIRECFDRVTISIDGSSAAGHDWFRGSGNFDKSLRAIGLLEEYGVYYELSMTVNSKNIEDIEAASRRFGSKLRFAPLFPAGSAKKADVDLSVSGKEYYDALNKAENVCPLSICENALESSRHHRACKCAIGNQEFSISPSGDVYPCQLLHYPEFLIGNIHSQSVSQLYASDKVKYFSRLTVDRIEGCRDCALKYICGGACRARSYHECGSVEVSGSFCEYEKEAFIKGIIDLETSSDF